MDNILVLEGQYHIDACDVSTYLQALHPDGFIICLATRKSGALSWVEDDDMKTRAGKTIMVCA